MRSVGTSRIEPTALVISTIEMLVPPELATMRRVPVLSMVIPHGSEPTLTASANVLSPAVPHTARQSTSTRLLLRFDRYKRGRAGFMSTIKSAIREPGVGSGTANPGTTVTSCEAGTVPRVRKNLRGAAGGMIESHGSAASVFVTLHPELPIVSTAKAFTWKVIARGS